jgi:hypothetical protein
LSMQTKAVSTAIVVQSSTTDLPRDGKIAIS